MSDLMIVPEPKSAVFSTQTLKLKDAVTPKALAALDIPFRDFQKQAERAYAGIGLKVKFVELDDYADQAYKLEVGAGGAIICARDAHGVFYGHLSLLQILGQCQKDVPCCVVEDAPDTPLRAFHLDMRVHRYKPAYLKDVFADLARLRYNAVVIQYEDAFPFKKELCLTGEARYTDEAMAEIGKHAAAAGLAVLPYLPVLGDLGWIVGLERYSGLRGAASGTIDPANPKAARLMCALVDELVAAHESPYFFVGTADADGHDVAQQGDTAEYLDAILAHVAKRGKTPVVWADMLRKGASLPKETIAVARCADQEHVLASVTSRKEGPVSAVAVPSRAAADSEFARDTNAAIQRVHELMKGLKAEQVRAVVVTSCMTAGAGVQCQGTTPVSLMRGGRRMHLAATWCAVGAAAEYAWNRAGANDEKFLVKWPGFWYGVDKTAYAELQFLNTPCVNAGVSAAEVIRDRKKVMKMVGELKLPRHGSQLALLDFYARLAVHAVHVRQIFSRTPTKQQATLLKSETSRLKSLHSDVMAESLFHAGMAEEQAYYFGHTEMLLARLARKR